MSIFYRCVDGPSSPILTFVWVPIFGPDSGPGNWPNLFEHLLDMAMETVQKFGTNLWIAFYGFIRFTYQEADVIRAVRGGEVDQLLPVWLDEEIGPGDVGAGILEVANQTRVVSGGLLLTPEATLDGWTNLVREAELGSNLAEYLRLENNIQIPRLVDWAQ